MGNQQQLSPAGAVAMGLLFIVCGGVPLVLAAGTAAPSRPTDAPAWVGVCAGLLFVLAGIDIIVDYAIAGGVGPDGDLEPGTSLLVRGVNLLLGAVIVGMLTAIFGWVAFGRGPRHFSTTIAIPFLAWRSGSGDLAGRVAFGAAALMGALMFVACGWVGGRRFARAWRTGR